MWCGNIALYFEEHKVDGRISGSGPKQESIEWILKGQAFSWSYDGSSPTPSPASKLDRRHTGRQRKRDILSRGWVGEKPTYDPKKAWSTINHSILSGTNKELGPVSVNGGQLLAICVCLHFNASVLFLRGKVLRCCSFKKVMKPRRYWKN